MYTYLLVFKPDLRRLSNHINNFLLSQREEYVVLQSFVHSTYNKHLIPVSSITIFMAILYPKLIKTINY